MEQRVSFRPHVRHLTARQIFLDRWQLDWKEYTTFYRRAWLDRLIALPKHVCMLALHYALILLSWDKFHQRL